MSFPITQSVTETSFSSSTTSHAVAMPTTVSSGDLLIILFSNRGTGTITTPSGWTQKWNQTITGNVVSVACFVKVAAGTEGGTTVDVVTSVARTASAQVYRIDTWEGTLSGVEVGTMVEHALSTTPNPPSLTPSWGSGDTLWIPTAQYGDDDVAVNSYPGSYSNGIDTQSGAGSGLGCSVASARRENTIGTEDPGNFTLASSEVGGANTIAIQQDSTLVFPVVQSVTETAKGTRDNNQIISMPTTVNSGDLLIVFLGTEDRTVTTPSGWTRQVWDNDAGNYRYSIYARVSDGTEGGTTVNFVTSGFSDAAAQVYRISNWEGTLAGLEFSSVSTAFSANPNSNSLSPSWGSDNTLWISTYMNETRSLSSIPANYNSGNETAVTGERIATAKRDNATATEDPGNFVMSGSGRWHAWTLGIQPIEGPTGWANKIFGIVPAKVQNIAVANISKVQGVA